MPPFLLYIHLNMKRFSSVLALFSAIVLVSSCCGGNQEKQAKYVFYFIGDGMGFTHVAAAESYLAQERGVIGMDTLSFTKFPVLGEATTFSASNQITCSSAAGTALSTGYKTNNGMLGIGPDGDTLTSIAVKIHNAGYSVGITSTVPINHATPAAFFAHDASRNNYYGIGLQLPSAGFEFYAGGGLYNVYGMDKDNPEESLYKVAEKAGYTIAYGYDDFQSKKDADKVVLVKGVDSDEAVHYAYGRPEGELMLSQIVESAVSVLEKNEKGFFLMAEGGQIDWAAHSNNLPATIFETIDFGEAIAVAVAFYEKHPDETLIVVTADHETGGIALGRKGYTFDLTTVDKYLEAEEGHTVEEFVDTAEENVAIAEDAKVGWTTLSHCGAPVPVWAIGTHSRDFAGRQDNTEIPVKICAAMGVDF